MILALLSVLTVCPPPNATVAVSPIGGGMDTSLKHELPSVHYDVTCPAPTAACPNQVTRVEVGPVFVYWAAEPPPAQPVAQHATPYTTQGTSASGNAPIFGTGGWGRKLTAHVDISCVSNTSGAFDAPAVVIPPFLSITNRTKGGATTYPSSSTGFPKTIPADAIPVETPFRLTPDFFVWPRQGETATVRITGPGIDFTKAYLDDPATNTASDSIDVQVAYQKDPDSLLTAHATGTLTMWLEFEGTKSDDLTFTLVPKSAGTGGGGGSSGSGGGSGGGGTQSGGGCSATGLGLPALLLSLALLRRRTAAN